jgi:hypothetical protein
MSPYFQLNPTPAHRVQLIGSIDILDAMNGAQLDFDLSADDRATRPLIAMRLR